uniref:Alpha-N-acetylglucosaminidase tim-barrel domain-containing protein n=1 Tax=Chromera velia CCMP2878 TaxID=1169474 RepID=A0A0G4H8Z8_9ALVE|eukprot:Cvel_25309.t1-p1 / transcript=Cvel_25309.t1 / gene=Cvel_25309 / organism=Chromera_velia_CCMP2878 / gene_product=Alpha-N-acetylglucosaminidase, putative / transcript_product=Alpha-N-acetylglucosaminidase, putative / location=Cvel_scaffold2848:15031-19721(+) / protein_length=908 / sequence_SO=supercontig / SO=protein_coding / is_pseudo=false
MKSVQFLAFFHLVGIALCSASSVETAERLQKRIFPVDVEGGQCPLKFAEKKCSRDGVDCFGIRSVPSREERGEGNVVLLEGNNAVSMASALKRYMKSFARASVSWGGNSTELLVEGVRGCPIPEATEAVEVERQFRWTYYLNICTHSYSMVWWDWRRWERELDWMAINGVNLFLAATGQEYVWFQLFKDKYGVSEEDLKKFFSGPGFLAWQRMGNLQGWGGGLSSSWLDAQKKLQEKILDRAFELGIQPVLPAFSGFVPSVFKSKFPGHSFRVAPGWTEMPKEFSSVLLVDPSDPLYEEIGAAFIKLYAETFGLEGKKRKGKSVYGGAEESAPTFYSADQYNEIDPTEGSTEYLRAASEAQAKSINAGDPAGVWVMSGWFLAYGDKFWSKERAEAYLSHLDPNRTLILDYNANQVELWNNKDSTDGRLFGLPFVWCHLRNFGGGIDLSGQLEDTHRRIATVREKRDKGGPDVPLAVGVGLTMEGIFQNDLLYESVLEETWGRQGRQDFVEGVKARYGDLVALQPASAEGPLRAWDIVLGSMYNSSSPRDVKNLVTSLPPIVLPKPSSAVSSPETAPLSFALHTEPVPPEELRQMLSAWVILVESGVTYMQETGRSPPATYRRDVVDFGRQTLEGLFSWIHCVWVKAIKGEISKLQSVTNDPSTPVCGRADVERLFRSFERTVDRQMRARRENGQAVVDNSLSKEVVRKLGKLLSVCLVWLDDLLSSDGEWRLDKWIQDARGAGGDPNQNEENAKMQLTIWHDFGSLRDYAQKSWGGLVSSFYAERWRMVVDAVDRGLEGEGPSKAELAASIWEFEKKWAHSKKEKDRGLGGAGGIRGTTRLTTTAAAQQLDPLEVSGRIFRDLEVHLKWLQETEEFISHDQDRTGAKKDTQQSHFVTGVDLDSAVIVS